MQKNNLKSGVASVDFTVTNLSSTGFSYKPGANEVNSTITVLKDGGSANLMPGAVNDNFNTTVDAAVNDNVMSNDDEGDAPASVSSHDSTSALGVSISIAASGSFNYTPPTGVEGTDTFGYTITDDNGDSDSAMVSITIEPAVNLLPDAVNDGFTTAIDSPVNGNVMSNDDEGDAPATVSSHDGTSSLGASISIAANGSFNYTPPAGVDGTDTFGYTITDDNGDSDSATVSIIIEAAPNLLPVANDDSFSTDQDDPLSANVLGNDDQGDAPATVSNFDAVSTAGGSVSMNTNGAFTYAPLSGYSGLDSFDYTITDSNGDSDSANVSITVVGNELTLTVSSSRNKGTWLCQSQLVRRIRFGICHHP